VGLLELDKLVKFEMILPPDVWLKHLLRCAKIGALDPEKQAAEDLKELYGQL
jgi:hypothetical protein